MKRKLVKNLRFPLDTLRSIAKALITPFLVALVSSAVVVSMSLSFSLAFQPKSISPPIVQAQAEPLFVIKLDGKWGYINRTGDVAISPQFEEAKDFCEGLAAVKLGEKYGYIDSSGQLVIQPQFLRADCFSEGLAGVSTVVSQSIKDGYIDPSGRMAFTPRFFEVYPFESGIAFVSAYEADGEYVDSDAYINRFGEVIVKNEEFERAGPAREGFVRIKRGDKYGYVDSAGEMAISPQFDWAGDFSEGLAQVGIDGKYGFIDSSGELAIELEFDSVWDFNGGLANVKVGEEKGVIDRQGAYVIALGNISSPFSGFSEGMAAFRQNEYLWGYMDMSGNAVIEPQFTIAEPFENGLARVKTNGLWGYIDRSGRFVVEPQFNEGDYQAEYRNGLITVREGRIDEDSPYLHVWRIGYMDREGNYVWPPSE